MGWKAFSTGLAILLLVVPMIWSTPRWLLSNLLAFAILLMLAWPLSSLYSRISTKVSQNVWFLVCAILGVSICCLAYYSISIQDLPKLEFSASASELPHHESSKLGGLKWSGKTRAMHVVITNTGGAASENISVVLGFNVPMDDVAQITSLPSVRAEIYIPGISALGLIVEDPTHPERGQSLLSAKPFSPYIRVTCSRIEAGDGLQLVMVINPVADKRLHVPVALIEVTGTYQGRYGPYVTELTATR